MNLRAKVVTMMVWRQRKWYKCQIVVIIFALTASQSTWDRNSGVLTSSQLSVLIKSAGILSQSGSSRNFLIKKKIKKVYDPFSSWMGKNFQKMYEWHVLMMKIWDLIRWSWIGITESQLLHFLRYTSAIYLSSLAWSFCFRSCSAQTSAGHLLAQQNTNANF